MQDNKVKPPPSTTSEEQANAPTITEKTALLKLARETIISRLEGRQPPELPTGGSLFSKPLGCFVTLQIKGQLRGCIGHIFPHQPLAEAVRANALSAAFSDPRFKPVSSQELTEIDLEISILTRPEKLSFEDSSDLLRQLRPGVDGVVMSLGGRRSTYLPQVWGQLPDKQIFLNQLCLKAGLEPLAWQNPQAKIEVYQAIVFGEHDLEKK